MCDRWSFWSEINGGTRTDTLIEARQKAIQHIQENPDVVSIEIYTSKAKKTAVGTVRRNDHNPLFEWLPVKGRALALKSDGQTRHTYY